MVEGSGYRCSWRPTFPIYPAGVEGCRTSETWRIPGTVHWSLALRACGALANDEAEPGFRQLITLGAGLNRPRASETDLPSNLTWSTEPLPKAIDVIGEIELQLDATGTAVDTAWIIILQDIATDNNVTNITAGYLHAGLRAVNDQTSRLGAPDLPCRIFQAVPGGEVVRYRIPLVPNARRFNAGHRMRLLIASDDQDSQLPALSRHRRYELS
jgi:predicted acyl esterase